MRESHESCKESGGGRHLGVRALCAKACARRTGDGIERLLQEWGGVGVADFTCMKEIIEARDGLPADDHDATTTITINDGHSVTVGQWSLEL